MYFPATPLRKLKVLAAVAAALSVASLARADLVHLYELNGNFNDSIGNVTLTSNGGTLLPTDTALTFGPNQGPTFFGNASLSDTYSIGLRFSLDNTSGYRKVIDFKNGSSDAGAYVLNGRDDFYPIGTGSLLPTSGFIDLVVTRDGTTGMYNSYIGGAQSLTFHDTSGYAIASLSGGNSVFRLFQDDAVTGHGEASGGKLDEVRVWNTALTADQVTTAFSTQPSHSVPDSGPGMLGGLSIALLAFAHWRRRARG